MKKELNILIPTSKGIVMEKVKNILCVCAEGSYCELQLINGDKHMISKNLASLTELLPPDLFFRIHASVIINLAHIVQIEGSKVFLQSGISFLIAQRRKKDFLVKLREKSVSL